MVHRTAKKSMVNVDVTATTGATPLVELSRIARGLPARIVAKLEMRNPCGSVKDRVAVALITDAEQRGVLRPGMTIVEPTGGNTGIGLAFAAAVRGYSLVLTMPESMSTERVALLRHFGAEVLLTPGILMTSAVERARQLAKDTPNSILLDQFRNPANVEIHRRTTAMELWHDSSGAIDVFVAAIGTGGTISGVGEVLKAHNPRVLIVGVEPAGAAILSGGVAGNHSIPGIGVGFIPDVLNRTILDEVIAVSDDDAFARARQLAREEGVLAGPSSGAALHAAIEVASRPGMAERTVAVLLADTGERYITTSLFAQNH